MVHLKLYRNDWIKSLQTKYCNAIDGNSNIIFIKHVKKFIFGIQQNGLERLTMRIAVV